MLITCLTNDGCQVTSSMKLGLAVTAEYEYPRVSSPTKTWLKSQPLIVRLGAAVRKGHR